jgi:uncharacterized protein (TIGR02453 family)
MPASLAVPFEFLKQLAENNTRDWFNQHKSEYLEARENTILFAEALLGEMKQFDHIETASGKKSLFRIYRDIRFSKDKSPYKRNFSGSFKRATKALRGGYYFHIEPGNTFIAGGFFGPNPADLKHIRHHIALDESALREVLQNPEIKSYFGDMIGNKVKTSPRGFERDHPAIDLLSFKQYILRHDFSDNQTLAPGFHKEMAAGFKNLLPFFTVMSEILTTDLNGHFLI